MNEWIAVAGNGGPAKSFYEAKESFAQSQKGARELEYLDTFPRHYGGDFLEEQKPKQ